MASVAPRVLAIILVMSETLPLAIMSDRSLMAQIRASEKELAAGEPGTTLDELRAELQRRRATRS
jgi:hypothetical protein